MNSAHRKTYAVLFAGPIPKSLAFRNVESMLRAFGCVVVEAEGSRVDFSMGAQGVTLHRPHPGKEIKPYQIRLVRNLLGFAEIKP